MLLLGDHIADGAVVTLRVVDEDELLDNPLELHKADVVFVFEPVMFEDPEPRFDPSIIGQCL